MSNKKCSVCNTEKAPKLFHKTQYKGKHICAACSKIKVDQRDKRRHGLKF